VAVRAATVAATAATAPLVAHHFGEVAPLAPLGNLALVPLVELGVVPADCWARRPGAIWEPLGRCRWRWHGLPRGRRWGSRPASARTRRCGCAARRTRSRPRR
jgi:hypothetical protein